MKEGGITGSYKKAEYDLTGEERGRVQIRIKTLQQHTWKAQTKAVLCAMRDFLTKTTACNHKLLDVRIHSWLTKPHCEVTVIRHEKVHCNADFLNLLQGTSSNWNFFQHLEIHTFSPIQHISFPVRNKHAVHLCPLGTVTCYALLSVPGPLPACSQLTLLPPLCWHMYFCKPMDQGTEPAGNGHSLFHLGCWSIWVVCCCSLLDFVVAVYLLLFDYFDYVAPQRSVQVWQKG